MQSSVTRYECEWVHVLCVFVCVCHFINMPRTSIYLSVRLWMLTFSNTLWHVFGWKATAVGMIPRCYSWSQIDTQLRTHTQFGYTFAVIHLIQWHYDDVFFNTSENWKHISFISLDFFSHLPLLDLKMLTSKWYLSFLFPFVSQFFISISLQSFKCIRLHLNFAYWNKKQIYEQLFSFCKSHVRERHIGLLNVKMTSKKDVAKYCVHKIHRK